MFCLFQGCFRCVGEAVCHAGCEALPQPVKVALFIIAGLALIAAGSVFLAKGHTLTPLEAGVGFILPGGILLAVGSLIGCLNRKGRD